MLNLVYDDLLTMCKYLKKNVTKGNYLNEAIQLGSVTIYGDIYIYDDLILESNTQVSNIFTGNSVDGNMQILICDSLQINSGVTLTPKNRCKGFTIYALEIINNGSISMTARGANAIGQKINLYKNKDSIMQFVPAVGSSGGLGGNSSAYKVGANGTSGTNRCTGGGGAGGRYGGGSGTTKQSGSGGNGTSYSGGTGGGGVASYDSSQTAGNGSNTGGQGGNGAARRTSANAWNAGGGVGNPGGYFVKNTSGSAGVCKTKYTMNENDGTGGLLNIFSVNLDNNGDIQSKGTGSVVGNYAVSKCVTGGSSGGGSINIYTVVHNNTGFYSVAGGVSEAGCSAYGGNGGDGCLTIDCEVSCSIIDVNIDGIPLDINLLKKCLIYFTKQVCKNYNKSYTPPTDVYIENKFLSIQSVLLILDDYIKALYNKVELPIDELKLSKELPSTVFNRDIDLKSFIEILKNIIPKLQN